MVAGKVIEHRPDMTPGEIVCILPMFTVAQDNQELSQYTFNGACLSQRQVIQKRLFRRFRSLY